MNWRGLFEGVTYPFEIVCPDGLVRHFAYMNQGDAEADAKLASDKSCRFYETKSSLEELHGDCPGGQHSVRRRDAA